MTSSILENAATKIARFNDEGLHYNLVADGIYKMHGCMENPFNRSFLPYLIAGLIAFDIGRMMGTRKYAIEEGSFASRLNAKLQEIRPLLEPLMKTSLVQVDLQKHHDAIMTAYEVLSARGTGALHADSTKHFHVGAAKVLHFLNPGLFIIVDSNASRAFKQVHRVPYRNTTQPGYSADLYVKCMRLAQKDILAYGLEQFQALEPNTPITRIYDKLTFVTGSWLASKN